MVVVQCICLVWVFGVFWFFSVVPVFYLYYGCDLWRSVFFSGNGVCLSIHVVLRVFRMRHLVAGERRFLYLFYFVRCLFRHISHIVIISLWRVCLVISDGVV